MAKIPSVAFVIIGLIIAIISFFLDFFVFIWIGVILAGFGVVRMGINWFTKPKEEEAPPGVANLTNVQNNPYDKEAAQVTSAMLRKRATERAKAAQRAAKAKK